MFIYYNQDGQITMTSDRHLKSGEEIYPGLNFQTYDHFIETDDDLGDKFMQSHKIEKDTLVNKETGEVTKIKVKDDSSKNKN